MYVSIFQVKFFFSILNQIRILVKRDRFKIADWKKYFAQNDRNDFKEFSYWNGNDKR